MTPEDLEDLLLALRLRGFAIGVDQVIASHQLVAAVRHAGAGRLAAADMAAWLAPVLCKSASEQGLFRELFELRFGLRSPSGVAHEITEQRHATDGMRWDEAANSLRRTYRLVALVCAVAFLCASAAVWRGLVQPDRWPIFGGPIIEIKEGEAPLPAGPEDQPPTFGDSAAAAPKPTEPGSERSDPQTGPRPQAREQTTVIAPKDRSPTALEKIGRRTAKYVSASIGREQLMLLILSLAIAMAFIVRVVIKRRSNQAWKAAVGATEVPHIQNITLSGLGTSIFQSAEFRLAIRHLRQHMTAAGGTLDVRATITSTIRAGGWFVPRFDLFPRSPEYIVLIDRIGSADQQARFADELIARLREESVAVTAFDFDGDPRISYTQTPDERPVPLSELLARHSEDRFILFSDGSRASTPTTGDFEPWVSELLASSMQPALLTPVPPKEWGYVEWTLRARGMLVYPANQLGIQDLASAYGLPAMPDPRALVVAEALPSTVRKEPERWLSEDEPEQNQLELLCEQLRGYLGEDGYLWLCSCALYPFLYWDLTVQIGVRLYGNQAQPLLLEQRLLSLVRLMWFRHGFLPFWLRWRLLRDLPLAAQEMVREEIGKLLVAAATLGKKGDVVRIASTSLPTRLTHADIVLLQGLYRDQYRIGRFQDYILLKALEGRSPWRWNPDKPQIPDTASTGTDDRPLRARLSSRWLTLVQVWRQTRDALAWLIGQVPTARKGVHYILVYGLVAAGLGVLIGIGSVGLNILKGNRDLAFAPYGLNYTTKMDFAQLEYRYPLTMVQRSKITPGSLAKLDQEQIDQIYARLTAGSIPDGPFDSANVFPRGLAKFAWGKVAGIVPSLKLSGEEIEEVANLLWRGKIFRRSTGVMRNRVDNLATIRKLGLLEGEPPKTSVDGKEVWLLFPARVYCGDSLLDGRRESIIINYAFNDQIEGYKKQPDFLVGRDGLKIRDEIRMVRPGFYLGRAYVDRVFVLNFTLYNASIADREKDAFLKAGPTEESCWVGTQQSRTPIPR